MKRLGRTSVTDDKWRWLVFISRGSDVSASRASRAAQMGGFRSPGSIAGASLSSARQKLRHHRSGDAPLATWLERRCRSYAECCSNNCPTMPSTPVVSTPSGTCRCLWTTRAPKRPTGPPTSRPTGPRPADQQAPDQPTSGPRPADQQAPTSRPAAPDGPTRRPADPPTRRPADPPTRRPADDKQGSGVHCYGWLAGEAFGLG